MKRFLIACAVALALAAASEQRACAIGGGGWSFAIGGEIGVGLRLDCVPGACGGYTSRIGPYVSGNLWGHANWDFCHGCGHGGYGYGYGGYSGYGGYGYHAGYSSAEPPADKKPTLPAPTPGDDTATHAGSPATQQVGYYNYYYPYQTPSYWYGN